MKHLIKSRNTIITTANKGSAIVIIDTENYIKEANCQVSDENNFKTLQTDPTLPHSKMLNDTLN